MELFAQLFHVLFLNGEKSKKIGNFYKFTFVPKKQE